MYIHEYPNWTNFRWDYDTLTPLLEEAARRQGRLYGRLEAVGFHDKLRAEAENLTSEVISSSEIEGIRLNPDQVRSSIARRLGLDQIKETAPSHYVESVVGVMMHAIKDYQKPIDRTRLCAMQAGFFPTGFSEGVEIEVGTYRTHDEVVVSGALGRERVHYMAPGPERVEEEMERFIEWFNGNQSMPAILKSGIAHLWFVAIHPFEDGNGRLARILSEMLLAKGDGTSMRFYNVSSQINRDKHHYYNVLELTERSDNDITDWLVWYVRTVISALEAAESAIGNILNKAIFWSRNSTIQINGRQREILNLFLDGYEAKITTKTWSSLAKCSRDTAQRDIAELIASGILVIDVPGAKRPSYSIVYDPEDLTAYILDAKLEEREGTSYLEIALRDGRILTERILSLDAQRYQAGDLPLLHLLGKYFISQLKSL